jgi:hypothetical protein
MSSVIREEHDIGAFYVRQEKKKQVKMTEMGWRSGRHAQVTKF